MKGCREANAECSIGSEGMAIARKAITPMKAKSNKERNAEQSK